MSANALYYPYIRVPENVWFTRLLLYWDRVGAIVPYEYLEQPEKLGPYMNGLVREELVTQVVPLNCLWRAKNFSDAFLKYVDARYGELGERYTSDWATVHAEKLGGSSVHMEKLHDLGEELCSRGLARRDDGDKYSPWFKMEPRVAGDFMAYLAGVLGKMPGEESFSPVTDRRQNLSPFLGDSGPTAMKHRIRELLLKNVLPAPSQPIDAASLSQFKRDYAEPLVRFRILVEEKISELSAVSDEEFRMMRVDDVTANLQETIDELAARMKEKNGWPKLTFGTLCAVVGSGISNWNDITDQVLTYGVAGTAVCLAPTIYDAFRGSDTAFDDEPLAYAAFAQKGFA